MVVEVKVSIPFNQIKVNQAAEGLEIVFPYGSDFYRCEWSKVPDRFKELYVVWLKLQGYEIPEWLRDYEKGTVDVSNVCIEINLNDCEKIPGTYPLM